MDPERFDPSFSFRYHDVGDVNLYVASAGPADAKSTVVMLHGFPEFWFTYRHQMVALAAAGYRVVVPDLRGYNKSDRPGRVDDYRVEHLVADVRGLLRALGTERVHLVGHDWGGEVAWRFAMQHPECLERLAVLNLPHPVMLMRGLRTLKQLRKSWYMAFFQLSGVAERLLSAGDFAALRKLYLDEGFSLEVANTFIDAFRGPRALTSALNWYRAAARSLAQGTTPKIKVIEIPTLVIWGWGDLALGEELAVPPMRWVPNQRVEFIPDGTHWVQEHAHQKTSELLIEFFG
jgi:pimeloyl-ACP methyl ester carboxylesterase